MKTKRYIVQINNLLYNKDYNGFVVASGRSLDRGFITPLTVSTIEEALRHFRERYYKIKKLAMKKYLFKTYNQALKFTQQVNITHVVDTKYCKIHEVEVSFI